MYVNVCTFASAWLSGVGLVTMSAGHLSLSLSQLGPCFHNLLSLTDPPRLPKSLCMGHFLHSVFYELLVLAAPFYPMESH